MSKNRILRAICFLFLSIMGLDGLQAQQFPGEDENIPFLITFGKEAPTSWGDDDYCQVFFLTIPKENTAPFYLRVFDPEIGGKYDELKGDADSECRYSIYGGENAYSEPDAQSHNPVGKFDSGNLLVSKTFAVGEKYDGKWYTFGPFNPSEGEWNEEMGSRIFKVIAQGISGDDGNIYKYFLSARGDENLPVEGGNAFTFEYTFRMPENRAVCHIYPYIDRGVISLQQYNFDWDNDGIIRIVSVGRSGETVRMSSDDNWAVSQHQILEVEKNTSLDIQLIKSGNARHNNVVMKVTNQYGEFLPFYSSPIGGKPTYRPTVKYEPIHPDKEP